MLQQNTKTCVCENEWEDTCTQADNNICLFIYSIVIVFVYFFLSLLHSLFLRFSHPSLIVLFNIFFIFPTD